MNAVFLKILNMSITGSWMILAVILIRLFLQKAPKWIPCLLWGLVAVRLVIPISLESKLSLIPSSETIPTNIAVQDEPMIDSGISMVDEIINPAITEAVTTSFSEKTNPIQTVIFIMTIVWILGIATLLAYASISYLGLKKKVSVNAPLSDRVLVCDEAHAPFILGLIKPMIYVPSTIRGKTLEIVLRHEMAHLNRNDHWWKPVGFLLLTLHWFNPLCWIAYVLFCRDIEMACDEKAVRDMNNEDRADYSQAILDCSYPKKMRAVTPLAFGEVGVKKRVRKVLSYKRPTSWSILVAIIICAALAILLMTDPSRQTSALPNSTDTTADKPEALRSAIPTFGMELISEPAEIRDYLLKHKAEILDSLYQACGGTLYISAPFRMDVIGMETTPRTPVYWYAVFSENKVAGIILIAEKEGQIIPNVNRGGEQLDLLNSTCLTDNRNRVLVHEYQTDGGNGTSDSSAGAPKPEVYLREPEPAEMHEGSENCIARYPEE